jgi:hypothetical protein
MVSEGTSLRTMISPGRGYRYDIPVGPLTPEQTTAYWTDGIMVAVEYRLRFLDPFNVQHPQTIGRLVRCRPDTVNGGASFLNDHTPDDDTSGDNQ